LKSCALHRESSGGTCGAADDTVRILGKNESQDPEFEKEYLSYPNEMEKLIRELPRDPEIVALFKAESAINV
jgi:hypothetical protein